MWHPTYNCLLVRLRECGTLLLRAMLQKFVPVNVFISGLDLYSFRFQVKPISLRSDSEIGPTDGYDIVYITGQREQLHYG